MLIIALWVQKHLYSYWVTVILILSKNAVIIEKENNLCVIFFMLSLSLSSCYMLHVQIIVIYVLLC